MPQISVIVPVYKVEPYLHRCVDSILSQTFTNFELILINDGSPDHCGAICDSYKALDTRVHVIHQTNQGLSAARNAGIDYAMQTDSEWITFCDSDDYVSKHYLSALLDAAKGFDISVARREMTDGEDLQEFDSYPFTLLSPHDLYMTIPSGNFTIVMAKLYQKTLFSSIRYPIGKIHEDEFITYKLLFQFEQIPFIDKSIYAHFNNPTSLTLKPWSPARLAALEAIEQQIPFYIEKGVCDIAKIRFEKYLRLNLREQRNIDSCSTINKNEKLKLTIQLNNQLFNVLKQYREYHWFQYSNKRNLLILLNAISGGSLRKIWRIIKSHFL